MKKRYTLITGASKGIGLELARVFAGKGHNIFLVSRDTHMLEKVAKELTIDFSVSTKFLALDLTKNEELEKLYSYLDKQSSKLIVDILINNAGVGVGGVFQEQSRESQISMVDLNIRALTALTHFFIEYVEKHKVTSSKIMHVGSIAGYLPGPFMAVYYASKNYVLSFGLALNYELVHKNKSIWVSTLCPGPTETDFASTAGIDKYPMFKIFKPMLASDVAKAAYSGLLNRKIVIIPGFMNKVVACTSGLIPSGLKVRMIDLLHNGWR